MLNILLEAVNNGNWVVWVNVRLLNGSFYSFSFSLLAVLMSPIRFDVIAQVHSMYLRIQE
jgi:hypothetical protein